MTVGVHKDEVALQTKLADIWRFSKLPDELRMRWWHVNHHIVKKFLFVCKSDIQL